MPKDKPVFSAGWLPPLGLRPRMEGEAGPHVWPFGMPLSRIAESFVGMLNSMKRGGKRQVVGADGRPTDTTDPSPVLQWAVRQYAELGHLPPFKAWPTGALEHATRALSKVQFIFVSDIGPTGRSELYMDWKQDEADLWLALGILQEHGVKIGVCPACRKFYADSKRRGKSACSPTCGNRLRARKHYDDIKAKPRKHRAYLKKQRELMKARRAAGLA